MKIEIKNKNLKKLKINKLKIIFTEFQDNFGYFNVQTSTYQANIPCQSQNQISNEGDNLRCSRCGKVYSSKTNLRRHERFECDGFRRFFCHICGSKYTQNGSLRVHLAKSHNIFVPTRRKLA